MLNINNLSPTILTETPTDATKIADGEQSREVQQPYVVKYKQQLKFEKIQTVMDGVANIQQSINWDATDLYYANFRLQKANNPKVLVKTNKELIGYATLKPQKREDSWYISQIAVMENQQRRGVGKAIMQKIFDEARNHSISKITLETDGSDEKLLSFYRSFHSEQDGILIREAKLGVNRFGQPKIGFLYNLRQTA